MEFLSIQTMIKLNVGESIVKGYMDLLMNLYNEALSDYKKLKTSEEENLINYRY